VFLAVGILLSLLFATVKHIPDQKIDVDDKDYKPDNKHSQTH